MLAVEAMDKSAMKLEVAELSLIERQKEQYLQLLLKENVLPGPSSNFLLTSVGGLANTRRRLTTRDLRELLVDDAGARQSIARACAGRRGYRSIALTAIIDCDEDPLH